MLTVHLNLAPRLRMSGDQGSHSNFKKIRYIVRNVYQKPTAFGKNLVI